MQFGFAESGDRGWTTDIFRGFNSVPNQSNPRLWKMDKFEDFDSHLVASSGDYTLTSAGSTATFAHDSTIADIGVWLLDCDSSTAAQGGNLQFDKWLGSITSSNTVAFEFRGKIVDAATGPEIFMGLSATDTTIIASSALTTGDLLGFSSVTDNNVLLFTSGNSAVPTASTTSPGTMTDGTYFKVGFRIERASLVEVYFNGVKVANSVASATLPDGVLKPSFVNQSSGTVDPILHLDWMRMAVSV
jgi:hypothetical protein